MAGDGTSRWAVQVRRRRRRARGMFLGALGAAALVAAYLFMRSPFFAVDHLRVSGYQRLTPGEIRDLAGIPPGTLIWRIDPAAVARRLERHPRVAGAVVRRQWPRGLAIELQERVTVAVLVAGGKPARWAEADGQGLVVAAGTGEAPAGLDVPVLEVAGAGAGPGGSGPPGGTGPAGVQGPQGGAAGSGQAGGDAGEGAPAAAAAPAGGSAGATWQPGRVLPEPLAAAVRVAAALRAAGLPDPARRLRLEADGGLEVVLASGIRVHWGRPEADIPARVRALAAALAAVKGESPAPAYIDVTDPQRPVLGGQGTAGKR